MKVVTDHGNYANCKRKCDEVQKDGPQSFGCIPPKSMRRAEKKVLTARTRYMTTIDLNQILQQGNSTRFGNNKNFQVSLDLSYNRIGCVFL